ncbi:MAG: aminotransferase class V-fold PLP-dependent enzyme [Prolixibacteraceae bacterium]|jgi:O-acetylhomoserine (thiol)-lyase|nr:aminotransferase class V-fold PLP-dependent enzyme [Prolixibacteraceae bacterium]
MKNFTTRSLNVPYAKNDPHRALSMPTYHSVAFEFDTAEDIAANFRGELPAHAYSRTGNPTVEYFEHKLKALTGAHQVLALASGMAAVSAVIMAVSKSGDNIISGKNLFGHTAALFAQSLKNFGLETRFADLNLPEKAERLIDKNTRAIFFETVTNPQLEIADIEKLSALAQKHGLLLIADSTLTPPICFHAARFGVDVEVMSTTKFISGGATSVGGAIADYGTFDWNSNPNTREFAGRFGKDAFIARLRKNYFRNLGACMSPQVAQLQIAGLDILELRFERCCQNTMALGEFLLRHKKVARVDYPGLPSSPYYELALKQFEGKPGAILTFDLESQEECFRFMNRLKIIRRATNLNDNKSLIIHPYSTIYNEFTELQRTEMNIRNTMMRLSVGIEGADDLMEDIEQALS